MSTNTRWLYTQRYLAMREAHLLKKENQELKDKIQKLESEIKKRKTSQSTLLLFVC